MVAVTVRTSLVHVGVDGCPPSVFFVIHIHVILRILHAFVANATALFLGDLETKERNLASGTFEGQTSRPVRSI